MPFHVNTGAGLVLDAGRHETQQLGQALPNLCDMVPESFQWNDKVKRLTPINQNGPPKHLMRLCAFSIRASLAGAILFFAGSSIVSAATSIPDPEPDTGWQNKEAVSTKRFMSVTAHPLATEAASAVLKKGGTAVDAAVIAQLVLNLVEPQSSGIGGGAFMLYWDAEHQVLLCTFNGFGHAWRDRKSRA